MTHTPLHKHAFKEGEKSLNVCFYLPTEAKQTEACHHSAFCFERVLRGAVSCTRPSLLRRDVLVMRPEAWYHTRAQLVS